MKHTGNLVGVVLLFAMLALSPSTFGAKLPRVVAPGQTLVLPSSLLKAGDAITELNVTIDCGYISALQYIPQLWDITMGFNMPEQQEFRATVRLGAAAANGLGPWAQSIRIAGRHNACFSVKVRAIGREAEYQWSGSQLHWAR